MSATRNTAIAGGGGLGGLVLGIALAMGPLKADEGFRTKAYIPVPGDRWTICYGETAGVKKGDTATPTQCSAMLRKSVERRVAEMQKCLHVPVSALTAQAMIRFGYNVGNAAFCRSVAADFNAGRQIAGCRRMARYVYSSGVKYPGLVRRREGEVRECLAGLA